MTPEEHKNELLKRIGAAIRGVHDISEESNEELVPGVYWPSRWLTDSIRAAQTEQKRKDAEMVKRMIGAGRHEIAATILAQEDG